MMLGGDTIIGIIFFFNDTHSLYKKSKKYHYLFYRRNTNSNVVHDEVYSE